jgi:hypothetical protein
LVDWPPSRAARPFILTRPSSASVTTPEQVDWLLRKVACALGGNQGQPPPPSVTRQHKLPATKKDLRRSLRAGDDLEDTFAWKEERTLSQALTPQYDKVIFILQPSEQTKVAIEMRVTVVDYPDGRLSIR